MKYILVDKNNFKIKDKTSKIYLPELPSFNWSIDVDKLKGEILKSTYFIS